MNSMYQTRERVADPGKAEKAAQRGATARDQRSNIDLELAWISDFIHARESYVRRVKDINRMYRLTHAGPRPNP